MSTAPSSLPIFRALGATDQSLFLSRCRVSRVRKGQIVIGHKTTNRDVYFVAEGEFQAIIYSRQGQEIWLRSLGVGACFGELAAIDGQRRTANVVALSDGILHCLPDSDFRQLLETSPRAGLWLLERFAAQIRALTDRVFELSALDVRSRICCELLRLALAGTIQDNKSRITPAPKHADIAARVASQRETVTREISSLVSARVITASRKEMIVLDLQALIGQVQKASGDSASGSDASGPAVRR